MDNKLTEQLQEYMALDENQREISQGALMLLKFNKNRILYHNIMARPEKMKAKLFYELEKFLKIRLDQKTSEEVASMEKEAAKTILPVLNAQEEIERPSQKATLGKRLDHDKLPDKIQAIYTEQATILHEMRDIHAKLRILSGAGHSACDRFELVGILRDKFNIYRENWVKYDSWQPGEEDTSKGPEEQKEETTPEEQTTMSAKEVNSARKYLSSNKKALFECKEGDEDKYLDLLAKCQKRLDALLEAGETISDEQKAEFKALGLVIYEQ